MHFQQDFRRFVLILVSGTDDDTPSVKGCFWLGYAVLGSIAWVRLDVKTNIRINEKVFSLMRITTF